MIEITFVALLQRLFSQSLRTTITPGVLVVYNTSLTASFGREHPNPTSGGSLGDTVGITVGILDGALADADEIGRVEGETVGGVEGRVEGSDDGKTVGIYDEGVIVGRALGFEVGTVVGEYVGSKKLYTNWITLLYGSRIDTTFGPVQESLGQSVNNKLIPKVYIAEELTVTFFAGQENVPGGRKVGAEDEGNCVGSVDEGKCVGSAVVGELVDTAVGVVVGATEGWEVGILLGVDEINELGISVVAKADGRPVDGFWLGMPVGNFEGFFVDSLEGTEEGILEGLNVGSDVGSADGLIVDSAEGTIVGTKEGLEVGLGVGELNEGDTDGFWDGTLLGRKVFDGFTVGVAVWRDKKSKKSA